MRITIDVDCDCEEKDLLQVVPNFGPRFEQTGPVVPPPQHVGRIHNWRKYMAASFTITDAEIQSLGPVTALKDKKGNAIPLPAGATCVWQCDTPTVFTLTPSDDTFTCLATAVGPLSSTTAPPVITLTINDSTGAAIAAGTILGNVTTSAPTTVDIPIGPVTEQP